MKLVTSQARSTEQQAAKHPSNGIAGVFLFVITLAKENELVQDAYSYAGGRLASIEHERDKHQRGAHLL